MVRAPQQVWGRAGTHVVVPGPILSAHVPACVSHSLKGLRANRLRAGRPVVSGLSSLESGGRGLVSCSLPVGTRVEVLQACHGGRQLIHGLVTKSLRTTFQASGLSVGR